MPLKIKLREGEGFELAGIEVRIHFQRVKRAIFTIYGSPVKHLRRRTAQTALDKASRPHK